MEKLRYYLHGEKFNNIEKITIDKDLKLELFLKQYKKVACELSQSDIFKNEIIKKGTTLFLNSNNNSIIVRYDNKDLMLICGSESLFINFNERHYIYHDGNSSYKSINLNRDAKKYCFEKITEFIKPFVEFDEYLPIDSTTPFMFLQIGLLDIEKFHIVTSDQNVLLCLNDFRKVNPKKMKLTIADAYTYEVVGTIEFSLNKKDESNFSYSGNVEYNISKNFSNMGYATNALSLLKSYVNELSDEYNKELYVATLVDDEIYQKVALNNGGVLEYDGTIPSGELLKSLNKIDQIKIYRITDK